MDNYLKGSPFYHEEVSPKRLGESGDPLSYSLAEDGTVAVVLLLCVIFSLVIMSKSWRLVRFQTKNLFRMPRENSVEMRETADEMRYQTYFCLQGVVVMGLLAYSVTTYYLGEGYALGAYYMLGVFAGMFAAYYMVREILLAVVHGVFFDKAQRHLDSISRLFIMAVQGAVILPLAVLHVYLRLSIEITLNLLFAVFGILLLLQFYKSYNIFFRKNNAFLQFFLYLCTLEAVPLALLAGTLLTVANYLKINI